MMTILVFKVEAEYDNPTDQELARFLALETSVNKLRDRLAWAIGDVVHESGVIDESPISCELIQVSRSSLG